MAISLSGRPDIFSPTFNPIFFYVSSTSSGEEGFNYLVDIFPSGNTSDRLCRFPLYPRPNDSFGVADISQVLRYKVSKYLSQYSHKFANCPQNYYKYQLALGEEYVKYWPFTINFNTGDGYLTLSGNSQTHQFVAGDEVLVDYNVVNPINDGVWTVLTVPSTNSITIPSTFLSGGSGGNFVGTVVYANKRKTLFSGLTWATGYTAFNAAIPHQEFNSYTSSTYNITSGAINLTSGGTSSKKWLSNIPTGMTYSIRPENSMWLNFYSTSMSVNYTLEITTNTGVFYYPNTLSSTELMAQVGCGPVDINAFVTSATCYDRNHINKSAVTKFDCDTTYYSIRLVEDATPNSITSGGTIIWGTPNFLPASETITVLYDSSDTGKFTNIELYFMDRKGSIVPCNFTLLSSRSINKTSAQYKSIIGDLNSSTGKWGYDSTEAGTNTINTTEVQELTVSTNFMTVEASNYFKELFTSKFIYIKENGSLWPVFVLDSNLPLPTKANRKNINKVLTVIYANNNTVQN